MKRPLSNRSICFLMLPAALLLPSVVHSCYGVEKSRSVIDVGSKKQLFIDEMFIESGRGVHLTMNPPYQTGELLITNDKPWESEPGTEVCCYCSVLKENNLIRIWYDVYNKAFRRVAYAESTDGIHFTKPELNLVEVNGSRANNVVLPGIIGGCAVWVDPKAPPQQRYKTQAKAYPSEEFHIHTSPDGYRWTLLAKPKIGHKDTQSIIFWDDSIRRYVLYTRKRVQHEDRRANYRTVRRLESDDLIHWENESIVMKADKIDLATYQTPTPRPPVDYYGAVVFRYPDADGPYIMMANAYWHWYDRKMKQLGPDTFDVRLAVSRDGKTFKRVGERKPFLRLGPEGSFYSRMVWAMPNPIRMGDEIWVYYQGTNHDHSDRNLDPVSSQFRSGISRAVMRLDGFVSADADYTGGEIITPLLRFKGKTLELNLDAAGGGSVLVELLDENGRPMKGYTEAEATPLCGNSVRMPVSWGERRDVSKLAAKPVKIRFLMRDCKLYAFQFKNPD